MSPAEIHSFTVHFTVALFTASVLFDILGEIKKSEKYHFAAWLNLLFSAIAAIFSLVSGLLAKGTLTKAVLQSTVFETHQNLAFLILVGILAMFLWRSGLKGAFPSRNRLLYLVAAVVLTLVLLIGAWFGGHVAHR